MKPRAFLLINYMAPFDMKCSNCFKIIKKGKKLNTIKRVFFNKRKSKIFFFLKCIYCYKKFIIRPDLESKSYLIKNT